MVRIFVAAVLSLLLVGMQREALLHEVDHLRAKVAVGHAKVLQQSSAGECAECALLASGSNTAPPPPTAFVRAADPAPQLALTAAVAPAASKPSPYRSRAPPIVL